MLEPILVIQDFNILGIESIKSRYRDIHLTDASGKTLLFYAVSTGRVDIFEDLLKRGIRISARDDQGETVLFEVIRRQRMTMLKKLMSLDIDVQVSNDLGQTPLHIAAQSGIINIIKILREAHASHEKDLLGRYPMHEAVLNGKLNAVKWFYTYDKQSLFTVTDDLHSNLHLAVMTYNIDLIQYLIEEGVDINGLSLNYDTPLHLAVRHHQIEAIEMLLTHQAFMDIPNKQHLTPLDECQHDETLLQIFEKYQYTPVYEAHVKTYERIHSVLKRDRQAYLQLESIFAPDPLDRYQKKARDYITHYHLEKKFKG